MTYQWWQAYELGSPAESASLTWVQFSEIFLREFVPQSFRDAWCVEFEQLLQGTMSVLEYAVRFNDLARHAPHLVAAVVGIARRGEGIWGQEREDMRGHEIEYMRDQEREDREARRHRRPERFTGPYFGGKVRHGRGFVGQPVQFALQASHNILGAHGSQSTRTTQFPQPHQQKGCFECGDTSHRVRDCPRLQTGVSQQSIQESRGRPRGEGLAR
ncbi:uncharacterized protein [Nicotiana tomentosiformis]|uniref:uncharacterized protein n=1 Tax=Nicotiana tomentosiformis TaxID=4098 RepID=UPI00388CDEDC